MNYSEKISKMCQEQLNKNFKAKMEVKEYVVGKFRPEKLDK